MIKSDDPIETQYEEYHNNPPMYTEEELKRKRDEINNIGKELQGQWINIRWTKKLDMQIQTEENGEWVTVVRFSDLDGHNHKNDYKPT